MIEFDYNLDYKNTLFKPNDKRYRIGRGEQGVLLVRPYTDDICKYWRFKTLKEAKISYLKAIQLEPELELAYYCLSRMKLSDQNEIWRKKRSSGGGRAYYLYFGIHLGHEADGIKR